MKNTLCLCCAVMALMVTGCNKNNYSRDSEYVGQVAYEHPDETVVRPKKTKTMTVKRDLTTTDGGTVRTRTVTETVTVPEDTAENADDIIKAQRAINAGSNYYEINVNENKTFQRK